MSKDIDVKEISNALQTSVKHLQRYVSFLFLISILGIYSFLVFQIGSLSQAEPSDEDIAQQNTVKRLKADPDSIEKIKQLEDQNVGVQSLFEAARDNPFQD